MARKRHGSGIRSASLEERYLSELGDGRQERDDMLHALCRIADQMKRLADQQDSSSSGD